MPNYLRTAGLLWVLLNGGKAVAEELPRDEFRPVYLAFAGPYSSSPSSAFGHLFLVLPSNADEPVPLWDVVSFVVETSDAAPIRYLTRGITGGFLGRYERLDFHEKTRDYEVLEDRDLWLVELNLTAEHRQALDDELAVTAGRWYPYTFFNKNCAYYLQMLLANAIGVISPPSGMVSPTDVLEAVRGSKLAGSSYFRPAVSRRLQAMSGNVDEGVITRLRYDPWTTAAQDTAWLQNLPRPERRFVQEFFAWKALRQNSLLDEASRRGLALLRVLNAREAPSQEGYDTIQGLGQSILPPAFHRYTRFRLSYLDGASTPSRVSLRYRGALHDESDPWLAQRPLNTMELLAIEVSAPTVDFSPRLDALVLFSQRSLSSSDWITTRNSWMLEGLVRRGGLFGDDALHLEARVGFGKTVRLPYQIFAYGLITAAGVGQCCDQVALAPGLEAGLVWLAATRWRQGLRWTREHDISDWSLDHQRVNAWVRYDLGRDWGVIASGDAGPLGDYITLSLDWYP